MTPVAWFFVIGALIVLSAYLVLTWLKNLFDEAEYYAAHSVSSAWYTRETTTMSKLIIMRGLPSSGKSTRAKEIAESLFPLCSIVNRDTLRLNHPNYVRGKFNKKVEKFVAQQRDNLIREYLTYGNTVISDDTNLTQYHVDHLTAIAKQVDPDVEVEIIDLLNGPLAVSVDDCIERDRLRENSVGKDCILRMWYENCVPPLNERNGLPDAWLFDIDGTLAHMNGRSPFEEKYDTDTPDFTVTTLAKILDDYGFIILMSGRQGTEIGRAQTQDWLDDNFIPYDKLLMRKEGDNRKDSIVKQELYEEHVKPFYDVLGVFDDRPQVVRRWRELGLKVFDCGMGYEF